MNILTKNVNKNEEYYRVFGMTACKIIRDYDYKFKSILGIFVRVKEYTDYTEKRVTKLCNIPLVERIENLENIELSIFKIFKRKINKEDATKKILKKLVAPKYNKVFILKSNLGEAYLFLKFILNGMLSKSDTPLIIATKKYHLTLINMLVPNVDKIYTQDLKYEVNKKCFLMGDQCIYVAFPLKFYIDTEEKVRKGNCHYLSEIYNFFNISKENILNINKVNVTTQVEKQTREYLLKNNIKNFIFLSTEATTCENIDNDFWKKLEKDIDIKVIKNSREMSIEEAYCFAQKAVATITLRSGLSEILSGINNLQIILYTNFKKRYRFDVISDMKVSKGYSIKLIEPSKKNIHEIEYSQNSQEQILEWIKDIVNMRIKSK